MKTQTKTKTTLRKRSRSRARSRGFGTVSTVMEAAMVIGWFVVLIVGEKGVSAAADARRSAEDSAEASTTASAASNCQPKSERVGDAQVMPSLLAGGMPNASAVISAIAGLGLGGERTFANYIKPLQNILTTAISRTKTHQFEGQRESGCLEKPIDTPKGSMDQYRMKIWMTHLQGY